MVKNLMCFFVGLLAFWMVGCASHTQPFPIPQACTEVHPCPYFTEVTPERLISVQRGKKGTLLVIKEKIPTLEGLHVIAREKGSREEYHFYFTGLAPRPKEAFEKSWNLLHTYMLGGEDEKVKELLEKLHQMDPSDPEVNRFLVERAIREGDWEKAAVHLSFLEQYAPWYDQTYALKADMAMARGSVEMYEEALELYRLLMGFKGRQ